MSHGLRHFKSSTRGQRTTKEEQSRFNRVSSSSSRASINRRLKSSSRKTREKAQEEKRNQQRAKRDQEKSIASRASAEKRIRELATAAKAKKTEKPSAAPSVVVEQTKRSDPIFGDQAIQEKEVTGITRVKETLKILARPFTATDKIVATTDNRVFNTAIEYVANNPAMAALIITASTGFQTIQTTLAGTAVKGTILRGGIGKLATGQLPNIAVNTKTATQTAGFLAKIAAVTKTPNFAYVALSALGTYPFSYFIKEEALQAIKGTYTGAIINKDFEQAQIAVDERQEILNPNLWEKIISAIPYANLIKQLLDYFNTAKIAVKIDQKILDDMKFQEETGESEEDKWKRIRDLELEQEKELSQLYTFEAKKLALWKDSLARKKRNSDANFWADQAAKQRELEAKDRQAIADFWQNYRIETQKIDEASRPGSEWNMGKSNLKFGLLG